jgi:hypothetical protein
MKANEVTMEIMDEVASYMNDEIREDIHIELASCTPEEFLTEYCNADPDFEKWCLNDIFGIEL